MLTKLKTLLLRRAYSLAPFDLKGDGWFSAEPCDEIKISCVINFYGRLDLLNGIVHSLAAQDYPRQRFEVVLVEDQGGTTEGREFCESFSEQLQIQYSALDANYGQMGYSRNYGLSQVRGEYVLFLDDDTVILQTDFLQKLEQAFLTNPQINALMPRGMASFAEWPGGYDFHDPHFLTSRCAAYRLSDLIELGGFMSDFIGQEDVECVVRFTLLGKQALALPEQIYYHPPLMVPHLKKPAAVGISFSRLRGRYGSCLLWLVAINCSRHMPLLLSFKRQHREMGRFGLGFALGFIQGWFRPQSQARYG